MYIQSAELASRYGLSKKEFENTLKENLELLNEDGEHVKLVSHEWKVDEAARNTLDTLLDFKTVAETQDELAEKASEDGRTIQRLQEENLALSKKLDSLTSAYNKLKAESDDLQSRFLSIQDGREAINSGLVRKYQSMAEEASKELEQVKRRLDTVMAERDKQNAATQKRIEELHQQLSERNNLEKAKLEADFHLVEAKKMQEKLYDELHQQQQSYDSLNDRLGNVQFEKEHADKRISLMLLQIKQAIDIVKSAESQLSALLSESDTKSLDAKAAAADKQSDSAPEATVPKKPKPVDVRPVPAAEMHEVIEKTKTEAKKTWFKKVASFIGL